MSDFFTDHYGTSPNMRSAKRRRIGAMIDPWLDLRLKTEGVAQIDKATVPRSVLIVGIEVPGRATVLHTVLHNLRRPSRHWIQMVTIPMEKGLGKFANIDRAIAKTNLDGFDWVVIVDDDVIFGANMLDRLITLSEWAGLAISQPAHSRASFASYQLTLRKPGIFVRETNFVEIGPVTAFHKSVFPDVIPFPACRWCYGLDLVWSELARTKGFKMGVVDAATVRHLRPIASSYDIDAAIEEGMKLTDKITRTRREILGFERVVPVDRLIKDRRATKFLDVPQV